MRGQAQVIKLNFARVNFRKIARIRQGLFVLSALLILAAFSLFMQARTLRFDADRAERELHDLSGSLEKIRPAMDERQRLVKNLGAMSALVKARKFSWVRLLSSLEEAFPPGVALTSIAVDTGEGSIALEGTSQSPESLSRFMIGLQHSRFFRNPQLKRQSLNKGILEFHVDVIHQDAPADVEAVRTER